MANKTEQQTPATVVDTTTGNVIVGVDGSTGSQRALDWALAKSSLLGPIQPVAAYHVEALGDGIGTPTLYHDLTELLAEDAENRLRNSLLPDHADLLDRGTIVRGYPGPALVRAAENERMLVVGSRGRSALAETLLGSVTSYCVKHSAVPVAVIPEATPTDEPLNHIVVGVDGSENAAAALRWALRHVEPGGRITAVHAWLISPYVMEMIPPVPSMSDDARRTIEQSVERVVAEESATTTRVEESATMPNVEVKVIMGDARNVLPEAGADADLLVVGARGHRGASYLLVGSVTTSLLHHPTVATVVVPGLD